MSIKVAHQLPLLSRAVITTFSLPLVDLETRVTVPRDSAWRPIPPESPLALWARSRVEGQMVSTDDSDSDRLLASAGVSDGRRVRRGCLPYWTGVDTKYLVLARLCISPPLAWSWKAI